MRQKKKFRHLHAGNNANGCEYEVTTMIRIIFSKCDPSTKSGFNSLKSELSSFVLVNHEGNMPDMLDVIQNCYAKIIHCRVQDDDFTLKVFDALGTSDNEVFLCFVKKERDSWEEDELDDYVDVFMAACAKKYNNMNNFNLKRSLKKFEVESGDEVQGSPRTPHPSFF